MSSQTMALASALAEDFTVLTYDRRGFSRSVVTEPVDDHKWGYDQWPSGGSLTTNRPSFLS